MERGIESFAPNDKSGRGHRTGDHAEYARTCWSGTFAMHDHFAFLAVDLVALLPGEVVMVLDIEDDMSPSFRAMCR